jgi:hypothetical protein
LNFVAFGVYSLKSGNDEGCGLASTVLRTRQNISSSESYRDCLLLNGGWFLESSFEDAHQKLSLQAEIFEVKAFSGSDILFI